MVNNEMQGEAVTQQVPQQITAKTFLYTALGILTFFFVTVGIIIVLTLVLM
jgi:hypothetical protein